MTSLYLVYFSFVFLWTYFRVGKVSSFVACTLISFWNFKGKCHLPFSVVLYFSFYCVNFLYLETMLQCIHNYNCLPVSKCIARNLIMYLSAVLIKIYFYFMSMNVSALHVWLVPTEARRGCWILTEVTGDCESQFGCWKLNLVLCKSKSILNCLTGIIFSAPLSSFFSAKI